jgi:hypothetical protein
VPMRRYSYLFRLHEVSSAGGALKPPNEISAESSLAPRGSELIDDLAVRV